MVLIKGWQKTSLIDYSPYTASVVFLAGCNFRCGYCHNPDLVLNHVNLPDIDEQAVLNYLEKNKQWIDGVCVTGGEPTLHSDLPGFIAQIKEKGMKVKLDTNGTNPSMVQKVMGNIDYFAMDIKNTLNEYKQVTAVDVNEQKIQQSIDLIRNSGVDYEFRTTVIPGIVGKQEIKNIGAWLQGSKRYILQNFRGGGPLVDNKLKHIRSYSRDELEEMKIIAQGYFDNVDIRG